MKIAYLIHSLWNAGGTEKVLTLKANYLSDVMGYDVSVITSCQQNRPPFFSLSERVTCYDINIDIEGRRNLKRYFKALDGLLSIHPQDIVVSFSGNEILCLPFLHDNSKKIGELHFSYKDLFSWYGNSFIARLKASARRSEVRFCANKLDAYVVLTKAEFALLKKKIRSLRQIYNPLSFFPDTFSDLSVERFIAVGRLIGEKNYSGMFRIWSLVQETHPQWELHIFGDGPLRNKLQKQINDLGLNSSVFLRGHSTSIQKEMAGSSGILMTSTTEGFPMVLLEAAACGLPIITYDCSSGIGEIVEDGRNGFIVRSGDEDVFASRCNELIENPSLRSLLGTESRSLASAFGIDSIMQEWDTLFKEVLS